MEFCVEGGARGAAIELLELETASPRCQLRLSCGPVSIVEGEAEVVVYALDEDEQVPACENDTDKKPNFLLRIRRDALCAEFEQGLAEWCATRGVEYVYESGEPDDGVPRLASALSEALSAQRLPRMSNEPVVCVAGYGTEWICDRLRSEFSGFEEFLDIETKYYRKRVRLVDFSDYDDDDKDLIQAVVLVVDSMDHAEKFWKRLDVDCGTRILVSKGEGLVDWILDNHFEIVDPTSEDPHDGIPRLADALKCTLWTETAKTVQHNEKLPQGDDLDDLFALAAKLRDRSADGGSEDHQKRRQDAADLALRLAATLGLDDDESSDDNDEV